MHFDVNGNAPSASEASIVKTVVAFSNGQKKGGELIVGVKDNLEITGLEDDYKSISMVKKVNTKVRKETKLKIG